MTLDSFTSAQGRRISTELPGSIQIDLANQHRAAGGRAATITEVDLMQWGKLALNRCTKLAFHFGARTPLVITSSA
jgi:hypothetical protein